MAAQDFVLRRERPFETVEAHVDLVQDHEVRLTGLENPTVPPALAP